MTPQQKIKWAVLAKHAEWKRTLPPEYPNNRVDDLYKLLCDGDEQFDALNELREGQVETGLPCKDSRLYESKAVAMKMPDDTWVGWTYWFGGGKWGTPAALDWMNDAYDVDCHERQEIVTSRTFKLREGG